MFLIDPEQMKMEMQKGGVSESEFETPETIVLTFSTHISEEIRQRCQMADWKWVGWKYAPYSIPNHAWIGEYDNNGIGLLVPPMGASPLIALCEELIHFGTEVILLLCASWSLGEGYLKKGEIHLPSFSTGIDGTSIHYGNKRGRVNSEPFAFRALSETMTDIGIEYSVGGVGSCEAFYRINNEMLDTFRESGCLSMDNGEAISLYALAQQTGKKIGILLQPYIDLTKGWSISYMDDDYKRTCKSQADVALSALNLIC